MPNPAPRPQPFPTKAQRRALGRFEDERDALFLRLEHDRLVPLDAATA